MCSRKRCHQGVYYCHIPSGEEDGMSAECPVCSKDDQVTNVGSIVQSSITLIGDEYDEYVVQTALSRQLAFSEAGFRSAATSMTPSGAQSVSGHIRHTMRYLLWWASFF